MIFLLTARAKSKMFQILIITVICIGIVLLLLWAIPPSKKNPQGTKQTVEINGHKIGFVFLNPDCEKPVLLICGGGPGISQYLLECLYPTVLQEYFNVCYFDYRGTGLSFDKKIKAESITTKAYIEDVDYITEYLKNRFNKEKIYIMGHSFGSYIALLTVNEHPEKYIAYLAMSQNCNQKESEYIAYDYMKQQYELQNNKKMIKAFDKNNIRENDQAYYRYFTSGVRDKAMHELGVGTTREMKSVITGLFFSSFRCKEYSVKERFTLWRGKILSNKFPVLTEGINFNAFEAVPALKLPVYFLAGKYDYTCCEKLQRDYYQFVQAPEKEYFLFENSAHSPVYEDSKMARQVFNTIINSNLK